MKKLILLFALILSQTIICNTTSLTATDRLSSNRLSSNFLSLMLAGDINIAYENKYKPQTSWTVTYHISPSSDTFFDESGTMMRFSFGYRFFKGIQELTEKNQFFEFKLSTLSDFTDVSALKVRKSYLFFEAYVGEQIDFNESLFYEYKIGFMRDFSYSNKFYPAVGFNLGTYL
ncbi:MAG: hypothetical protein VW397_01390 [Candidatus Margulisiibacteriota bacterium]